MRYSLEKGLLIFDRDKISRSKISVPLAVNWNITGNCTNECIYCFGKDIAGLTLSPHYTGIAENILGLSPEIVVVSGGEPLAERGFVEVVNALYGKTNLILDTNGLLIDDDKIQFFKDKNFHLRVSLDSENPAINEKNRPSRIKNSTETIKSNLLKLREAGVPVTVQTTVTHNNYGSLSSLGEYLKNSGIDNWRIAAMIPSDTSFKEKLVKSFKELKSRFTGITLRLSNCDSGSNSGIILFSPCGDCIVRGTANNDKDTLFGFGCVDLKEKILSVLDYRAHLDRYSLAVKTNVR